MSTTAEVSHVDFSLITNVTSTISLGVEPGIVDWKTDNKMRNVVIGSVLLIVNALTLVTVIRSRSLRPHIKVHQAIAVFICKYNHKTVRS